MCLTLPTRSSLMGYRADPFQDDEIFPAAPRSATGEGTPDTPPRTGVTPGDGPQSST